MDIQIRSCTCPLCGNEDKVKGFKTCDRKGRWWSVCYADHSEWAEMYAGTLNQEKGLWYTQIDENKWLTEDAGSDDLIVIEEVPEEKWVEMNMPEEQVQRAIDLAKDYKGHIVWNDGPV